MRPRQFRLDLLVSALLLIALIGLGLWLAREPGPRLPKVAPAPAEGYLCCHWNVENFFDDVDDPLNRDRDEDWFGRNPRMVHEKVELLADALLRQNGGRGPDILTMVEVESRRAVELLRDALNAHLATDLHYGTIVQRDNHSGPGFAPAILSRLPARDDLTRTFGHRRMLEAHLEADGVPLIVLASHWTSRVTDQTGIKRDAYADALYREFLRLYRADPAVDVLMPGDFNDEPDDRSLRDHLHVTDDPEIARRDGTRPLLLDLIAGRDPDRDGTYFHAGWEILDHIVVSPGLLDSSGWTVLTETLRVEHDRAPRTGRIRAPRRFGNDRNAGPRGPSDHFPVTVRLRLMN